MDLVGVGARFRVARIKRRWRQEDVAARAGVSRTLVSRIEMGLFGNITLDSLLHVGRVLGIRIDWKLLSFGSDLDRMINARHAAMHEVVGRALLRLPGWVIAPEVSYSEFGERGVIDILAWHAATRTLLVIELKTSIVDVNELMGKTDEKQRLGWAVAKKRGWFPRTVAAWIIVADSSTNRRAVASHRTTLRAAFPVDGRSMRAWLRDPSTAVRALSFWSNAHGEGVKPGLAAIRRVRRPDSRAA